MPVIRGESNVIPLSPERRRSFLLRLGSELRGETTANGPVIFEIPLEQSDRIDVLVVWQEWENVRSEDRTDLILESYGNQRERIAQALGVTYAEATEQHLLPYSVVPMNRRGEVDPTAVRDAMLHEGGIPLSGEEVDLRFPTMRMAKAAHHRLCERLPRGYWSIVQTVASVP